MYVPVEVTSVSKERCIVIKEGQMLLREYWDGLRCLYHIPYQSYVAKYGYVYNIDP